MPLPLLKQGFVPICTSKIHTQLTALSSEFAVNISTNDTMTAITGINNNAHNAWTEKSGTKTAAADDAALFRLAQQDADSSTSLAQSQYDAGTRTEAANTTFALFGAVDGDSSGSIDDNESATLQQMVENAMSSMQPSSTAYSSSTVSLSDGTAEGTTSTTEQTVTQRYDLQQLAQQVLKQYDQTSAGHSSGSATGGTISKVA